MTSCPFAMGVDGFVDLVVVKFDNLGLSAVHCEIDNVFDCSDSMFGSWLFGDISDAFLEMSDLRE